MVNKNKQLEIYTYVVYTYIYAYISKNLHIYFLYVLHQHIRPLFGVYRARMQITYLCRCFLCAPTIIFNLILQSALKVVLNAY